MITDLYSLLNALVSDNNRLSEEDVTAAQDVITAAQEAGTLNIV